MATFKIALKTNQPSKRNPGKYAIVFRIYHGGTQKEIHTNEFVSAENFPKLFTNERFRDKTGIKDTLDEMEASFKSVVRQNRDRLPLWDCKKLCNAIRHYENPNRQITDFIYHFGDFILYQKRLDKVRNAAIYEVTKKKVIEFFGKDEISIEEITLTNLERFRDLELTRAAPNTVNIYLRNIRHIYYIAMRRFLDEGMDVLYLDMLRKNPFKNPMGSIRFPEEDKLRTFLTIEEMIHIRDFKFNNPIHAEARDWFMITFYLVGINMIDLYHLSKPKVKGRIEYKRSKSGRHYDVRLEPEIIPLLEKYAGKDRLFNLSEKFVDHNVASRNLLGNLKKAMKVAGISKTVNFYVARYTWSNLALHKARVRKEYVAYSLGHGKKKVTDRYLLFTPAIRDESNRNVLDLLSSSPTSPQSQTVESQAESA